MQSHILKPSYVLAMALSMACSETKETDSAEPNDTSNIEETGTEDTAEDTGPTTGVEDADGDGFSRDDGDCNDDNPDIYPGAPEIPEDGIDQDCDGFDAEANGMSIEDVMPGMLIITEIMKDPTVTPDESGEWFEVFNASPEFINLNGLKIMDDGTDVFTITDDFIIDGANYLVFGNADEIGPEGEVQNYTYAASEFVLGNGADMIVLANNSTVIDMVQYDNGQFFPDTSGYSLNLDIRNYHDVDNDNGENWCNALSLFDDHNYGTPGFDNPECPVTIDGDGDGYVSSIDCDDTDPLINPGAEEIPYDGVDQNCDGASDYDADGDGYDSDQYNGDDCNDSNSGIYPGGPDIPGDAIDQDCDGQDAVSTPGVSSVADLNLGDLIVSEIMNDPETPIDDTEGEWFEIYNKTSQAVDVIGLILSDQGQDYHVVSQSTVIQANAYAVFGRNTDMTLNGEITLDYQYDDLSLSNSSDEIILSKIDANGQHFIFDQVSYDGGLFFPSPTGASISLNPLQLVHDLNDFGDNWCAATSTYGSSGNLGTPGLANDTCD